VTLLGIALLALGVTDIVAGGLSGEARSRRRAVAGVLTGIAAAGLEAWWTGTCWWGAAAASLVILVATLGSLPGSAGTRGRFQGWLRLSSLLLPLGVLAALTGSFPPAGGGEAASWLWHLPFPAVAGLGLDRFVLVLGVSVALTSTANGVVRAVLAVAGTSITTADKRLRGGRLIGPLERLMIFGLAVSGNATAAALVVSAKSLLRFPELSRQRSPAGTSLGTEPADAVGGAVSRTEPGRESVRPDVPPIDVVTEYFVVGSLASWLLALAPVVLLKV
jgi:hypothetical protein